MYFARFLLFYLSWGGFLFLPTTQRVNLEERRQYQDKITFSSAYFEKTYTNEQLAHFPLDLMRAEARLEQRLVGGRSLIWWERLCYFGYESFVVMNFQINVLKLIYHEIGHALRWRAFGERNTYTLKIGSERTGGSNFFAYFVRKILQPMEDGATGYSQEEYSEFRERITKETAGPLLILSAGGLNNEVYLSEKETEMLHENGELHRGITLSEKNAIYGYWEKVDELSQKEREKEEAKGMEASCDVIAALAYYQFLGIPVTKEDMVRTGTIATWLSGTTYSHIVALWNFAWNKHLYCARPLEFFGFAVPDTFPYLTTKGISYKVISGYRLNEKIRILFGFEHVFVGIPTTEYMLGIRHKLGEVYRNISYKIVTVFGKQGFNLESSFSIPIGPFSFTAGFNTYASQSLLGERHSMDLNKKQSHTGYLSVAYVY